MSVAISGLNPGNNATIRANNVAAVNAAIALGADTIEFPKGTFYFDVNGIASQFDGTRFFGQGEGATKLVAVGSGSLFDTNAMPRQVFAGMTLQGYGNHTGGAVIKHRGPATAQGANSAKFEDLTFEACHDGIDCTAFNSVWIERVNMINMRGYFGLRAAGAAANQRCDLFRVRGFVYNPHPSFKVAANATGIVVEGYVHTIQWEDVNITAPYRGILVHNPNGLAYQNGPKLIEGRSVRIDYPVVDGLYLDYVEEAFFDQSYFHGSETENNVYLTPSCQQIKISQSKITGAAKCNLYTDADDTELVGNDYAYANQANGGHPCVAFGPNSWTGRVIGGVAKSGNQSYGLANWHTGNGPNILRVGTSQITGISGAEAGF